MFHSKSIDETLNETKSAAEGLTEQDAAARLIEFGENKLEEPKKKGLLYRFFLQFKNVMVIVLLAAAVITAAVAIFRGEPQEFIDVGIIFAIVIINAVIGVVQESKAEQALEALKKMSQPFAKVRRGGEIVKIETYKIVPGDLVILEAGDVVPADMRLIKTASLKIEESALTGESVPVEKNENAVCAADAPLGDRFNMAYASCTVSYGRGEGIATETGSKSQMGKIADMLKTEDSQETPMQRRLNKTGKFISIGVLCIAALIFIIGLVGAALSVHGIGLNSVLESFMTSVAIAVAAIPEGLTAVITIIMAIGVRKMSARNAIVKKLPAVETLGSTDIICSDKTGTLTLNKMTVLEAFCLADGDKERLLRCMTLCNDTSVVRSDADGKLVTVGDPTETALTRYAHDSGVDVAALLKEHARFDEKPFDSDRKMMTTVNRFEGKETVYTKGAPDMLLENCTAILDAGKARPITADDKKRIIEKNRAFAQKALRVLAYAYKDYEGGEFEEKLIFIGLTGMIDPPRPEVKAAVKICKKAGITPVMITGDHKDTAFAIAKEIGIADDEGQAITGAELNAFTDEQLQEKVQSLRVYARVSPEHKVRIVKAWRALGKVVAMTGDGVNDAPSIKAADIGIGMGITGTDVTKGAADIVLADDNFATIVDAVAEGRKIFSNMRKTIQFLLAANIAEVLSLLIASIVFSAQEIVFLLPIQILWINLVTDSLPAVALGLEPSARDIMDHPPQKVSDNLFAGRVGINIIYQGLLQSALVLGAYFLCVFGPWNSSEAGTTMAFLILSLVQLFHCFNARSLNHTIFNRNFFKNKMMFISFGVGLALTLSVALIPGVQGVFGLSALTWQQWLVVIGASVLIIPLVELIKALINIGTRKRTRKQDQAKD